QSESTETRLAAVFFRGFMPKPPSTGPVENGLPAERDGTQTVGQMPCLAVEWSHRLGATLFRHGEHAKDRKRPFIGTMVPKSADPRSHCSGTRHARPAAARFASGSL